MVTLSKTIKMAFNITILLMLAAHSTQTMNKPMVPRQSNNIAVKSIYNCIIDSIYPYINLYNKYHVCSITSLEYFKG